MGPSEVVRRPLGAVWTMLHTGLGLGPVLLEFLACRAWSWVQESPSPLLGGQAMTSSRTFPRVIHGMGELVWPTSWT